MKRVLSAIKSGNLARELRDLETRSDDELKARWSILYDTEPPQKVHRSLLLAAVAHRMQEKARLSKIVGPPPSAGYRQPGVVTTATTPPKSTSQTWNHIGA